MTKPWERQKGESSKSFAWFEIYLDLRANRKYRNIIEKIEAMNDNLIKSDDSDEDLMPVPTLTQLQSQAQRWHWSKRARGG